MSAEKVEHRQSALIIAIALAEFSYRYEHSDPELTSMHGGSRLTISRNMISIHTQLSMHWSSERIRVRMPECQNCGAFVTTDLIRVFGIDGEIHSCPECSTYRELTKAPDNRER